MNTNRKTRIMKYEEKLELHKIECKRIFYKLHGYWTPLNSIFELNYCKLNLTVSFFKYIASTY
ncbi:hypothetical protein BpHYR1_010934 [Brachionus plicatilis]|uniref:Uncharacterized protein n=1 Tax=Brachionus plicatilis TaxID=10195 RepID=A0A3M7QV25_BRAPC|nr:hypothetical protein BpHYR1_010934 [Brachionus plicatilis]